MTKFKFPHFFRPKKWQSPNFQAVSEYFRIISFGIPNSIRNLLLRARLLYNNDNIYHSEMTKCAVTIH